MCLEQKLEKRFVSHLKALNPKVSELSCQRLWQDIGEHYCQPSRHYHSLTHLDYLLTRFDSIVDQLSQPHLIAMALYYHDIIYNPTPDKDEGNEAKSAEHSAHQLADHLTAGQVDRIAALIRMTQAHQLNDLCESRDSDFKSDAAYFLDLDLSILGASQPEYRTYARAIRQEYRQIPDALYRQGRIAVLQGLLLRPRIYLTHHFYKRLEQQARYNISQEVAALHAIS